MKFHLDRLEDRIAPCKIVVACDKGSKKGTNKGTKKGSAKGSHKGSGHCDC